MDAVDRGLRFGGAILAASLAAGPIFWVSALLVSLPSSTALLDWGLVLLALATIPYGVIFAFLPVLVGTAAMTALGAWFGWARAPLAWIAAGGLGGALFAAIATGFSANGLPFVATMVPTGAACAAICRAVTRWPEPEGAAQA